MTPPPSPANIPIFSASYRCVCVSLSVESNSLRSHVLKPVHGILQATILQRVAISFSRASSDPGIKPGSPALQADSLPSEPPGKPLLMVISSKRFTYVCSQRFLFSHFLLDIFNRPLPLPTTAQNCSSRSPVTCVLLYPMTNSQASS